MISFVRAMPRVAVTSAIRGNLIIWDDIPGTPDHPWWLISIFDKEEGVVLTPAMLAKLRDTRGLIDGLSLSFWDLTPEHATPELLKAFPDAMLFTPAQARQILELVDRAQADSRTAPLCVHCHAGIGRSGAVALFVTQYLGLSLSDFHIRNPHIWPNPHVTELLQQAAAENRKVE